MKNKGIFITFEGLEGSGKSTHVGLLASKIKEKDREIKVTREPGGTRIGEVIRQITHNKDNVDLTAVAESYLMAASRAQHVREIIRPAIDAGLIVICDRFLDSSLAYQGFGRELGESKIFDLNQMAIDGVWPDLTFYLDIDPEEGMVRRNGTNKIDRLDLQQKDFYQRVKAGYESLADKYKERYFIVNTKKEINDVAKIIWNKVQNLLKLPA